MIVDAKGKPFNPPEPSLLVQQWGRVLGQELTCMSQVSDLLKLGELRRSCGVESKRDDKIKVKMR
jgi:hypothetical protein